MEKIKVTAVVLNYNSSSDCKKCLDFLEKQDYKNLSTIIVDNASSNADEKSKLQQICKGKNIRLIYNPTNRGFSAGNNIGLRVAVQEGAEWMLVINPDVELRDSHYISYVMEQIPKWPKTAVVGTNTVLPGEKKQNPMRKITAYEEIMWPLEMIIHRIRKIDGYKTKDISGYCEKVSGCCFFVSKEFLIKNNYLDESVFMYCEEPILAQCVSRLGYRELYIKEVTANHEHYPNQKDGNNKIKMQMFITSRIYYIKKYSDYGIFVKKLAILSRKIQILVWKYKKDKGKTI